MHIANSFLFTQIKVFTCKHLQGLSLNQFLYSTIMPTHTKKAANHWRFAAVIIIQFKRQSRQFISFDRKHYSWLECFCLFKVHESI